MRNHEIVLQLSPLTDMQWSADVIANFVTSLDTAPVSDALLIPAFRVLLAEGWVAPAADQQPVELIMAKDTMLKGGQCILVTVALAGS